MITLRISAEVKEDRQVLVTLPNEVPLGKTELLIVVGPDGAKTGKRPRSSLADWAEANAEDWGDRLSSEDVEGFTGRRY